MGKAIPILQEPTKPFLSKPTFLNEKTKSYFFAEPNLTSFFETETEIPQINKQTSSEVVLYSSIPELQQCVNESGRAW